MVTCHHETLRINQDLLMRRNPAQDTGPSRVKRSPEPMRSQPMNEHACAGWSDQDLAYEMAPREITQKLTEGCPNRKDRILNPIRLAARPHGASCRQTAWNPAPTEPIGISGLPESMHINDCSWSSRAGQFRSSLLASDRIRQRRSRLGASIRAGGSMTLRKGDVTYLGRYELLDGRLHTGYRGPLEVGKPPRRRAN